MGIDATAQRREVHILSANDMHAALEAFPALADVADSLRALYPGLLVFSAGDNRTGEPLNDMYEIPAYPMVALMNQIGFDATTLGNHEFDSGPRGLARLIDLSHFSYLCANAHPADSLGVHLRPYQVFDVNGVKVGVIGVVQLGTHGKPDSHPDNCVGFSFTPVNETVAQYEWLRKQCDVVILLSHNGYEADVKTSALFPWLDLIIGGHTHRQLSEEEPLHNGVLITQNRNLLSQAVHITLTIDGGRVIDKNTDYLIIRAFPKRNQVATELVKNFNGNPFFKEVLTHAVTPFGNRNEIGTMVCDALREETGADIAVMNYKGVRITKLDAGDITVRSAFEVDPYGSQIVTLTMKGDELEQFLIKYGQMNTYKFPHLSGMRAELTVDEPGSNDVVEVKLMNDDGGKFNRKKTYRVVTNTYVISTNKMALKDTPKVLNTTTSDAIMSFLKKQPSVDYQNKETVVYTTK
jgi:2',3'-cyclic-nucleotide 2'-phosphodiesterase (5'-nucleotidase family)